MAFNRKGERTEDEFPRQAILDVTFNILENILQMPKGYHIAAIYPNAYNRTLEIVVESPDLPQVPDGAEFPRLPELDVTVTTQKFRANGNDGYWHQTKVTWRRTEREEAERAAS